MNILKLVGFMKGIGSFDPKQIESPILWLNAENYSGGSTWDDLSGNTYNFSLNNSPSHVTHKSKKCFQFSGWTGSSSTSSNAQRVGSISQNFVNSGSLIMIVASVGNNTNLGPSNGVTRLFSMNNNTNINNDYSTYMCLAMNEGSGTNRAGLFIGANPIPAPTTQIVTSADDYKMIVYTWTGGPNRTVKAYCGATLEMTSSGSRSITNSDIQKISIAANAADMEFCKVRVAQFMLYDKELTSTQVQNVFNKFKTDYNL